MGPRLHEPFQAAKGILAGFSADAIKAAGQTHDSGPFPRDRRSDSASPARRVVALRRRDGEQSRVARGRSSPKVADA